MIWQPVPPKGFSSADRNNYFAGYSDAWYGYKFGNSDTNPSSAYRLGFEKGEKDRLVSCKISPQPALIILRNPEVPVVIGGQIQFKYHNGSSWECAVIDQVNDDGYFFATLV